MIGSRSHRTLGTRPENLWSANLDACFITFSILCKSFVTRPFKSFLSHLMTFFFFKSVAFQEIPITKMGSSKANLLLPSFSVPCIYKEKTWFEEFFKRGCHFKLLNKKYFFLGTTIVSKLNHFVSIVNVTVTFNSILGTKDTAMLTMLTLEWINYLYIIHFTI